MFLRKKFFFFFSLKFLLNCIKFFFFFKTIGYSCKPSNKNEDGLVCLMIKGSQVDIKANQTKIVETLTKIFGSNPAFQIEIESIKPLVNENADKKEVCFIKVMRRLKIIYFFILVKYFTYFLFN